MDKDQPDPDKDAMCRSRIVVLPYEADSWIFIDSESESKPFDPTTYNKLTGKTKEQVGGAQEQPEKPIGRAAEGDTSPKA